MKIVHWVEDEVCTYVGVYTPAQRWIQQGEGSGPTRTAFIHKGLLTGPQNIGQRMLDKNPFSNLRTLEAQPKGESQPEDG